MALTYEKLMSGEVVVEDFSWTDREVMLYALGIGLANEPLNRKELPFIYERRLKVLPTFATVIAPMGGASLMEGINFVKSVDGERKVILHKPLTATGKVKAATRIAAVYDKGPGKGSLVIRETLIRDAGTDELIATRIGTNFARGDGGIGGPQIPQPTPHAVPERAPDRSITYQTRLDQAALYRLNGDRNPLHIDPDFAIKAGFPKPILHGMCTYGITGRAVLETYADFDPAAVVSHQARFSKPVFPGDPITIDMWQDGTEISFQAHVPERGLVVTNGLAVLKA